MKVFELLERQQRNMNHYIRDNQSVINYAEWHRRSFEVAERIKQLQIWNESIVLFLPNSIQYAVAYFGILYSGNVIVPIDMRVGQLEIESTLRYCEAKLVITDMQHYTFLREALQHYSYAISIYLIDTHRIIAMNSMQPYIESSGYDFVGEDVVLMLHTSGTTSNPKRVMLTNENLISNIESNIASLQIMQRDVVLIMLPMCFGYCNTAQFLTHTYLGTDIVIYNAVFFAKDFFKIVELYHITCFTAVPYMLYKLLAYQGDVYKYSSLRYICFGGSKINEDKLRLLINRYPQIGFVHTYGQTECSPRLTALSPKDAIRKIGSVGKPIPGVYITIKAEEQVGEKEVRGEILVRGRNVMKGYFKQEEITKSVYDGWLHTGDLYNEPIN